MKWQEGTCSVKYAIKGKIKAIFQKETDPCITFTQYRHAAPSVGLEEIHYQRLRWGDVISHEPSEHKCFLPFKKYTKTL